MLPFPYPVETIPDQAIFAPHHLYIGVFLVFYACLLSWNDFRGVDPWAVSATAAITFFSFAFVWPYYPVIGATGTLLFTVLGFVALALRRGYWSRFSKRLQALIVVGLFIALDDAVSHALFPPTPLDLIFHKMILEHISAWQGTIATVLL